MAYENLLYEKKNGIATITFNRPKVLNALNRQTVEELHRALLEARDDAEVAALAVQERRVDVQARIAGGQRVSANAGR